MKHPNIVAALIIGASIIVASLILAGALRRVADETHYAGDRISYSILNQGK